METDKAVPNRYHGHTSQHYMSTEDWQTIWKEQRLNFHKTDVFPFLKDHAHFLLAGKPNAKIFIPLCGKTIDMKWLSERGHTVIGVDSAEQAAQEFFQENDIEYVQERVDCIRGTLYKTESGNIKIYVCNILDFNSSVETDFDGIWDRGSLVAINKSERTRYAAILESLMSIHCHYLLASYEYDDHRYTGPPHCVRLDELKKLFGNRFEFRKVDELDLRQEKMPNLGFTRYAEVCYHVLPATLVPSSSSAQR